MASRKCYHMHVELPVHLKERVRKEFPAKGDLAMFIRKVIDAYFELVDNSEEFKKFVSKHKTVPKAALWKVVEGHKED